MVYGKSFSHSFSVTVFFEGAISIKFGIKCYSGDIAKLHINMKMLNLSLVYKLQAQFR